MLAHLSIGSLAIVLGTLASGGRASTPEKRATPNAPDGYTPSVVPCPDTRPAIRSSNTLSPQEIAWLQLRTNNTIAPLKDFLNRTNIGGIDTNSYIDNIVNNGGAVPRIGIAVSGGGYRALLNGAGAIEGFDSRTANSTSQGHVGGLLQAATYLSGLSGGSWVVGSLYVQNFTSVESIVTASSGFLSKIWQFDDTIFGGPDGTSLGDYYGDLHDAVKGKKDAGYNTSITDYWARALSYQLVNATDGGPSYTFSSIANDTDFSQATAPMPIIVAIERSVGELVIAENSTSFEFNPWEMGSYDPSLAAFAPLKYVGSNFSNGVIGSGGSCVAGFDNAGFVMGTSSSLFNQFFLQLGRANGLPDFLIEALNDTLAAVSDAQNDIASWPNPFFEYNTGTNANANSKYLSLVDGGEDLQNIPINPLTVNQRQVDVIFAIDSSADTETSWPNGTSLVATYERSRDGFAPNNQAFPEVPDVNTFVNLGLNKRPTFFGCGANETSGPLVVYIPNAPYSFNSNFSTFNMDYTDDERNQIIHNGYNVVTMGNGTVDSQWPACVACAVLARSLGRTGTTVPDTCIDCFTNYCWNGTTNSTTPEDYDPAHILEESGAGRQIQFAGNTIGAVIALYAVLSFLF